MRKYFFWLLPLLLFLSPRARAVETLQQMNFTVDGVARTALVYVPATAKTQSTPLVFVFHGHGGTSRNAAAVSTSKPNGRKRPSFTCKVCRRSDN